MTIKKSAGRTERAGSYGRPSPPTRTSTDLYVEELWKARGSHAKPVREARAVIDKSTGSLTEAIYESRRDRHS